MEKNSNHFHFAEDTVIIASNLNAIESMLKDLDRASNKSGLKMNMNKTKVKTGTTNTPQTLIINNTALEQVEEYIYLGQRMR